MSKHRFQRATLLACGLLLIIVAILKGSKPSKQAQLDCAYIEAVMDDRDNKYEQAQRLLLQGASPRGVCVVWTPVNEWTWGTTYYVRGKLTVREKRRLWRGERKVLEHDEDF